MPHRINQGKKPPHEGGTGYGVAHKPGCLFEQKLKRERITLQKIDVYKGRRCGKKSTVDYDKSDPSSSRGQG